MWWFRKFGCTRFLRGIHFGGILASNAYSLVAFAQSPEVTEPEAVEVVVRVVPPSKPVGELQFTNSEASRGAGTNGDPTKVVETLPGFSRGGPRQSEPIAWGSAPEDTKILVDGVEIPRLFHGSAVRSVVPTPFIESLSFTPGGFGAENGRAIGGIVRLTMPKLDTSESHWRVTADTLDTSVYGSTPIRPTLAVALAARYGYVNQWLRALFPEQLALGLFDVPAYSDVQGVVDFFPRDNIEVRTTFLGSRDNFEVAIPTNGSELSRFSRRDMSFDRLWVTVHQYGHEGSETIVTPFVGLDQSTQAGGLGSRQYALNIQSKRYGLRAARRIPLIESLSVTLGFDGQGIISKVTREGSLSVPPREGDPIVFGLPPGVDVAIDNYNVHQVSMDPYIEGVWKSGPLMLSPALRLSTLILDVSRAYPERYGNPRQGASSFDGSIEPRIALAWQVTKALTTGASVGRYSQPPVVEELGSVFGTPTLSVAHATHVAINENFRFLGLEIESTLFYKQMENLAVRSNEPWPSTANLLLAKGEGRSYGTSAFLRKRRGKFQVQLSATVSRSERTFAQSTRRSEFDQPWQLALVLNRTLGNSSFGVRARYNSGSPRTPVVARYYDTSIDGYQPVFGSYGTTRLPNFFQLDLRFDKRVTFDSFVFSTYLELLNVTFRKNPEELVYSADYAEQSYVSGMPPMVVLGIGLER
jgi:hypothetical protein